MATMGWCPSGRLFEAAACATPILSDWWDGLDAFFEPEAEILIAAAGEPGLIHGDMVREGVDGFLVVAFPATPTPLSSSILMIPLGVHGLRPGRPRRRSPRLCG